MADNIVLKTFKGGSVTPLDDAIIHQTVISTNGIFKGCEVSFARSNILHVAQGFGMIKGRFFEVYETEIPVRLNNSPGTLQGRLYIHMDLSNADEPIQFVVETAEELSDLSLDEDVNYNNSTFDLELATFRVTSSSVSGLESTFSVIKGASGGGAASTLQRLTAYEKGDFATCSGTPGWVTLYCVRGGETATREPLEYGTISKVGDMVQDGTCVFSARDLIRELDSIYDSLASAEGGIKDLEEELLKQLDKLPPPVGSIKFSATQDIGDEWLPCDGSFVNERDYPELVKVLGKCLPAQTDWTILSKGKIGAKITNAVRYKGHFWMYSHTTKKLYGVPLEGGETKVIPVTSTSTSFPQMVDPATMPTALSIVDDELYLVQLRLTGTISSSTKNPTSITALYKTGFTGEETALELEDRFTGSWSSTSCNAGLGGGFPTVVKATINAVESYYMSSGLDVTANGNYQYVYLTYWYWNKAAQYPQSTRVTLSTAGTNTGASKLPLNKSGFNKKNGGEMIYTVADPGKLTVMSLPKELYRSISQPADTEVRPATQMQINSAAVEGGGYVLMDIFWDSKEKAVTVYSVRESDLVTAAVTPELHLPSGTSIPLDGCMYLPNKAIWLLFVGTGILFTRNLQDGAEYGFLNTMDVLGVLSGYCCAEYDEETSTVYIIGQDSNNQVTVASLKLPTLFNYANDGAWLPVLASDGIPAYIKAKEIE